MSSSNVKRNFYDILNATSNATTDELKSNYKQLILQSHPDKLLQQQQQQQQRTLENSVNKIETYDDLDNTEFVAITEAWNCLKDPLKRKQYDAELLLNKFHTHNNIYAHIKLSEMKKQLNTNDDEEEKEEEGKEVCNTSKFIYTYDCRCGGQYIVDESAEQFSRIGSQKKTNHDNNLLDYNSVDDDDDDAGNQNNKSRPTNIHTHTGASGDSGGGGIGKGVTFNEENDGNDDEEDGGELIVECSECSLVIILNG